jgi:hypothetical protein
MSKSELKRQCTQNPLDAAERIAELEQRVKVLYEALERAAQCIPIEFVATHEVVFDALNQTPQQTAEQIERGHIEWMMKLNPVVFQDCDDGEFTTIPPYDPAGYIALVAIPKLPGTKE